MSRASAHGYSQLKHQKLKVGGYTKEVLECVCATTHPGRKVGCQGPGGTELTCIVASPALHQGQPSSGKRCIMLESGLTRSLAAKLLQHLSLAVCKFRVAITKNTNKRGYRRVCVKNLMWRLKHIRTITAMYVSPADLLSIHHATIFAWWAWLHAGPQKTTKLSKLGVGTCPGQYGMSESAYG